MNKTKGKETQYRLKQDVPPESIRNLVHQLLCSLRGKRYQDMTITEASLVNNNIVESYEA